MKTKKVSRVLALLLSLVMLLGALPMTALAESSVVVSDDAYDKLLAAAVAGYYNELMACESVYDMLAIMDRVEFEQGVNYMGGLEDEAEQNLIAKFDELSLKQVELDAKEEVLYATNFSNAAPFLEPAVGTSNMRMMMMSSASRAADDGLELRKTVSGPENGEYTLTLEAWATGTSVTTETNEEVPTDIILVLDQSGSMTYCMYPNCSTENCSGKHNDASVYTKVYDIKTDGVYYYYSNYYHGYYQAYYCNGYDSPDGEYNDCEAGWYTQRHGEWMGEQTHRGTKLTPKATENGEGTQFYTYSTQTGNYEQRTVALKNAVQKFVSAVYEKAGGADKDITTTGDNVHHRIAIVGFGSEDGYGYNTEILTVEGSNSGNDPNEVGVKYKNLQKTHFEKALQDVSLSTGQTMVNKAINALAAEGATEVDLGLDMANDIFANSPIPANQKRNRIVVVLTDGTPTTSRNYDSNVANAAIKEARILKALTTTTIDNEAGKGATVYSVGIFGGADGSNPSSLPGDNDTDSNRENRFMHLVSSNYPDAQKMGTPGSINSKLESGKSYYLSAADSNTLENIFETIAKDVSDTTVKTELDSEAVVKDVLTDQFVLPDGVNSKDTSRIKVYTSTVNTQTGDDGPWIEFAEAEKSIDDATKTISVSNFDFAANWVGETVASDGSVTAYHGTKLRIVIPIEVRDGFLGGNGVLTNAAGSGVYEDSDAETAVKEFTSPSVNVPIHDQSISVMEKNVYLNGTLTQSDLLAGATIYPLDVYGNPVTGSMTWQADYATVSVQNPSDKGGLEDDTTYTVTLKVTPLPDSTVSSVGTVAQEKPATATGNINVFKPELTFKDDQVDYMSAISETGYLYNNESKTFAADNLVSKDNSNQVKPVWKTESGVELTNQQMTGEEPTLTLAYAPTDGVDTNGKVDATDYVPVKVTVVMKITTGDKDVTANTKFVHLDCTVDETCKVKDTGTWATKGNDNGDPAFLLHVINVVGDLKITKQFANCTPAEGETFKFTIVGEGVNMEVIIKGNDSIVIKDLKLGQYTVTEDDKWSWRYMATSNEENNQVTVTADDKAEIIFTNTLTKKQWLDGSAYAENRWQNGNVDLTKDSFSASEKTN